MGLGAAASLYPIGESPPFRHFCPRNTGADAVGVDRSANYYPAVHDWGYSLMNCGYGYARDQSGYCTAQEWYSATLGCYETTIIQRELSGLSTLSGQRLTSV